MRNSQGQMYKLAGTYQSTSVRYYEGSEKFNPYSSAHVLHTPSYLRARFYTVALRYRSVAMPRFPKSALTKLAKDGKKYVEEEGNPDATAIAVSAITISFFCFGGGCYALCKTRNSNCWLAMKGLDRVTGDL